MKTLQLTTEVIQNYHLLFTLLVVLMIEVVFIVDLFIYTRMLKKRNRLKSELVILELNEVLNDFLVNETVKEKFNISKEEITQISEENVKIKYVIPLIKEKINEIQYKIDNYKGLSKHILGILGVK